MHLLIFDKTLLRPGCAIIQSVMGGDIDIASHFPAETWLVSPTSDMVLLPITDEQLPQFVEIAIKATEQQKK